MLPWKTFWRFFSAVVLMATGGFAAAHELPLPVDINPTEVSAPPAATDGSSTTTTTIDTSTPAVDGSTTTTTTMTTAPSDTPAPVAVDPVADPAPTTSAPTSPAKPAKPPVATPAPADPPPAAPVDGDAPAVCAAAAAKACGPTEPAAAPADHAARVQRCQDWWNSLADAFDKNNRPEWATRAREIAGRCEAMISRWEQMEQRWQERHQKGDHNGDGRPDKGWHNRDGQPKAKPEPKAKQVSRHSEGRH